VCVCFTYNVLRNREIQIIALVQMRKIIYTYTHCRLNTDIFCFCLFCFVCFVMHIIWISLLRRTLYVKQTHTKSNITNFYVIIFLIWTKAKYNRHINYNLYHNSFSFSCQIEFQQGYSLGLGLGWNYLLCEQESVIERKKIALLLNSMVYKVEGVEKLLPRSNELCLLRVIRLDCLVHSTTT
jgi:uncharacterized protein with PQ loop repeat